MTEFSVRFGTPDGAVVEQRQRALSADALRRELENKGLHVFQVRAVRGRLKLPLLGHRERIKGLDFLVFNQQLATLLGAGMPVLQSLELLQKAQATAFMREVLARVLEEVRSGVALSEAFQAQGALFPRLYTATLLAGERSGELVTVLRRYIEHQQLMEAVRRRVTSALTYPIVLIGLSMGLVVLLVAYVIPRFSEFFLGFAGELPLPTQIVMTVSQTVNQNLLPIGIALVVGLVLMRIWVVSGSGQLFLDRLKLRLPVVGPILHLLGLSQFVRSLATLLSGGTPLVSALEVATTTVTNRALATPLARSAGRVREGQPLYTTLQSTGLFADLSIAMVQVGEATGALEEMLFNVGRFYDETIEVRLARLVALIEPAVLVVMGVVVAALLLSVYMPMFSLLSHAR